jgi:hypothetical protein
MESSYINLEGGSLSAAQTKLENPQMSTALCFVAFIIRRPPISECKTFAQFLTLRTIFFLYFLFFLCFGVIEFIDRFTDYFWLLHLTMMVKMIVLRVSLKKIGNRLEWQSCPMFLHLMDSSIPFAKSYMGITSVCNFIVMGFYYGVWYSYTDFESSFSSLCFILFFIGGTCVYVLFSAAVLIVSITDAKVSRASKFLSLS